MTMQHINAFRRANAFAVPTWALWSWAILSSLILVASVYKAVRP